MEGGRNVLPMRLVRENWNRIIGMALLVGVVGCVSSTSGPSPHLRERRQAALLQRFEGEIRAFERRDSLRPPAPGGVLFVGSSSIRLWASLEEDMAPLPVLNRGFGGSTLPEELHYAGRIVFPYQPALIVLYCGENDIQAGDLPEVVFQNFKRLVALCRERLPATPIVYLSMKPSPSRWEKWPAFEKGNAMIRRFADSQPGVHFVDVSSVMLRDGRPDGSIFLPDSLHMNAEGYRRWTEVLKPVLLQLWETLPNR